MAEKIICRELLLLQSRRHLFFVSAGHVFHRCPRIVEIRLKKAAERLEEMNHKETLFTDHIRFVECALDPRHC